MPVPDETTVAADKETEGAQTTPPQPQGDLNAQQKITELGQENANLRRLLIEKDDETNARIAQLEAQFSQKVAASQDNADTELDRLKYEDPDKAVTVAAQKGAQVGAAALIQNISPALIDLSSKLYQQEFYDDFPDIKKYVKNPDIGETAKMLVAKAFEEVKGDPLSRTLTPEAFKQKVAAAARVRFSKQLKQISTDAPMHTGGSVSAERRESNEEYNVENAVADLIKARRIGG